MADKVILGGRAHRARIIAGIRKWCDEQREFVADIDHWNRANPNEEPIEIDDVREMLASAEQMLANDPGHGPIAPFQYRIVKGPSGIQ